MRRERDTIIVFGGMIGVGKSSYTELVANHLDSTAFYESVDDNPFLDIFYANPQRYAFTLQIHFLNTRFRAIKEALKHRHNVLDRSIYEDALFATLNAEDGNMTNDELQCYLGLLDNMLEELTSLEKKSPDLFIYLRASFETIESRIKKRGREFEQFENNEELEAYMRRLHSRYDEWVFQHYNASEVLVIDADKYDISRPEDRIEVLAIIDQKLEEQGGR